MHINTHFSFFFFFFQAEDGIRDVAVTGVQTCALPIYLTRLSLELAARMIFLGKLTPTLEEARELAEKKLLDGSGYRKLKDVIQAQGGNPAVLDRFELLPNATGAREITSPRAGYVSALEA